MKLVYAMLHTAFTLALGFYLSSTFLLSQYVSQVQINSIQSELELKSSKIIVFSLDELAVRFPKEATEEQVSLMLLEVKTKLIQLKNDGYIIVNSSAVLDAPEENIIDVDTLVAELVKSASVKQEDE